MFHTGLYFVFFLEVLFFTSCTEQTSSSLDTEKKDTLNSPPVHVTKVIPKELSLGDYQGWLKQQDGFTYDQNENDKVSVSILYKPLMYEAAISGGSKSKDDLQKVISVKKGFHYLKIECLDKNQSVSNPTNKEELFKLLKENIWIIQDQDTVSNAIVEIFPAQLLNQPHQVLVMIPVQKSFENLKVRLTGKPFKLPDLKIAISKKQYKSFPEIKL